MNDKCFRIVFAFVVWLVSATLMAQTGFSEATALFLLHSGGNHLEMGSDDGGWIESSTKSNPQRMVLIPDGKGY